jgi:hypothetical protein
VRLRGAALGENARMHALARACGFGLQSGPDGTVEMTLELAPEPR